MAEVKSIGRCQTCGAAPSRQAQERDGIFWKRVQRVPLGCWIWLGSKHAHGYGVFHAGNKKVLAHRFAWELTFGAIPSGLSVCHRCDNPPCVNPDHLFLGTQAENNADRHRKGRTRHGRIYRGEAHVAAKIRIQQVLAIRGSEESQSVLSARFGISKSLVSKIKCRKLWLHLG